MTLASDSDSQTPIESWRDAQQAALCAAYRRLIYILNEGIRDDRDTRTSGCSSR